MAKPAKPTTKTLSAGTVELKTAGDEQYQYIEGYGSVFGNVDLGGDVITRGAFSKSIKETVPKGRIPLLDGHDMKSASAVIGTVIEAKETSHGLWFRAKLAGTDRAQQIAKAVEEGHVSGLSIGFMPVPGKTRVERTKNGTVAHLDEVKLLEISAVAVPMNQEARMLSVKDASAASAVDPAVDNDLRAIANISDPEVRLAAFDTLVKSLAAVTEDSPADTADEADDEGPTFVDTSDRRVDVDVWDEVENDPDLLAIRSGEPDAKSAPLTANHLDKVRELQRKADELANLRTGK